MSNIKLIEDRAIIEFKIELIEQVMNLNVEALSDNIVEQIGALKLKSKILELLK